MDRSERFYAGVIDARAELREEIGSMFTETPEEAAAVAKFLAKSQRKREMRDLSAYIRAARKSGTQPDVIKFTIMHDILQFGEKGFLPRTRGYAAREAVENSDRRKSK